MNVNWINVRFRLESNHVPLNNGFSTYLKSFGCRRVNDEQRARRTHVRMSPVKEPVGGNMIGVTRALRGRWRCVGVIWLVLRASPNVAPPQCETY